MSNSAENPAAGDSDDLLTTSEISEWLGLSTSYFEIGRHKGYGPPYIRVTARRIRYRRADVLAWLAARKHRRTAEYA
jgi:predicted DNA-binding transcriptional regulator AlpA